MGWSGLGGQHALTGAVAIGHILCSCSHSGGAWTLGSKKIGLQTCVEAQSEVPTLSFLRILLFSLFPPLDRDGHNSRWTQVHLEANPAIKD